MNVFCFPYAGGSVFTYNRLKKSLKNEHCVIPVDYIGHGFRIGEPLSDSITHIIDDMYNVINKKDDGHPFALLGYSLGARLIFLMYNKYKNEPMFSRLKCIFFCAMTIQDFGEPVVYSEMSNEEMINYTLKMGGSKVNNADDKKVFLKLFPIIRNDFILFENTDAEISKIEKKCSDIPVFVMYSSFEKNIRSFEDYFTKVIDYRFFEGGHFFIHHHSEEMARYISNCINKINL